MLQCSLKLTGLLGAEHESKGIFRGFFLPAPNLRTCRCVQVLEWVKDGVRDFSISRAAVEWGIRIPADPKQTVYVWFDALLG
jgi:hypothetical protein